MPNNISKIQLPDGDIYNIKDSWVREELNNRLPFIDLGTIDLEDYDYDFRPWLDDQELVDLGMYQVYDEGDGFNYWVIVEQSGGTVYQEYWSSEEGSTMRVFRTGYDTGDGYEWGDWEQYLKTTDLDLSDYYTKDEVDELLVPLNNAVSTTWAELVQLRDDAELVPGTWYRITDYNFITTKVNVHSGNHQFDIIVLALTESMLSETAFAAKNANDHYFERQITEGGVEWLYSLYVDDYSADYGSDPIDHADDIHSGDMFCDSDILPHPQTGVNTIALYKTDTNEYGLDEPDYSDVYFYEGTYEYDGDDYDMWSKWEDDEENPGTLVFKQQYALTPIVVEDGELIVSPVPEEKTVPVNMNAWELKYCLDNDKALFDWAATNGKGVIYYMKDEFGNEAPYDFKNAMFERQRISSTPYTTILNGLVGRYLGESNYYGVSSMSSDTKFCYTFCSDDNMTSDASLFGGCAGNSIKNWIVEGQKCINDIVCIDGVNNIFDNDCYEITVRGSVNIFKSYCSDLLLYGCSNNTFEYQNRRETFYQTGSNKFGPSCSENVGTGLSDSILEGNDRTNNFGSNTVNLNLGSGCLNLTFGSWCYGNVIGDNTTQCTFGSYFNYNIIEGQSSNIVVSSSYVRYCTFDLGVDRITINTTGGSAYNWLQYLRIGKNVDNLTIAPTRNVDYEQVWYRAGRQETAVL